jgi:hypothetical protein
MLQLCRRHQFDGAGATLSPPECGLSSSSSVASVGAGSVAGAGAAIGSVATGSAAGAGSTAAGSAAGGGTSAAGAAGSGLQATRAPATNTVTNANFKFVLFMTANPFE